MAKSTKPKAASTKKENIKDELIKGSAELLEHLDKGDEIIKASLKEPVIVDTPPLVTLDEVKEVIPEPEKEVVVTLQPEVIEAILKDEPAPIKLTDNSHLGDLPMDEKIKNFMESREVGEIKMNDFLKSLFGVAKLGEPPLWQNQGATKQIKAVLDKLHNAGEIEVCGNAHMKLGMTYYPDTETMRAAQYDLGSVPIFCKKVN